MDILMDGCMDGLMGGWMDGWMDRLMNVGLWIYFTKIYDKVSAQLERGVETQKADDQ